jgi:hypothetical protein
MKSAGFEMPALTISWLPKAVIAAGVSCRVSDRRSPVTTMALPDWA